MTLRAIGSATAASAPETGAAASPTPPAPDLIPRPLYFLEPDSSRLLQIFRLDVDGRTVHQLTFEPANVDSYDVSFRDGRLAYSSNNQLFVTGPDGAGRRMLLDGGPVDENTRWTNSLGTPLWSPDGAAIAYSQDGLNFLTLDTGETRRVVENDVDTTAGFPIVHEIYSPNSYSPDGSRLLVNIGFYEGGTYGIYNRSDGSLIRFQRPDGGTVCCHVSWSPDGTRVYIASASLGLMESGLYYADVLSGQVSPLLPAIGPDGSYNFADAAQAGPDGKLYFFFNNVPEIPASGRPPLYLVRSAPDGLTGRTRLLPDPFLNLNEILWSPDASLAVIVKPLGASTAAAGQAEIVYTDGRPPVSLIQPAQNLRWGP